jgi:hypothetical protein
VPIPLDDVDIIIDNLLGQFKSVEGENGATSRKRLRAEPSEEGLRLDTSQVQVGQGTLQVSREDI